MGSTMSLVEIRDERLLCETIAAELGAAPIQVSARPRRSHAQSSYLSHLTREQDRNLRAAARRHCRRINLKMAHRIWGAVRRRQRAELLLELAA